MKGSSGHLHLDLVVDDAMVYVLHELDRKVAAVVDAPAVAQEILQQRWDLWMTCYFGPSGLTTTVAKLDR
jgi:hypothetical protein